MNFFRKNKNKDIEPEITNYSNNNLSNLDERLTQESIYLLKETPEMEKNNQFKITKEVTGYFEVDETRRLWIAPTFSKYTLFSFDDIISFELIENSGIEGNSQLSSTLAGAALYGVAGTVAKVSASNNIETKINDLHIKILTKHPVHSQVDIYLIKNQSFSNSDAVYKNTKDIAQKIITLLTLIAPKKETASQVQYIQQQPSTIDELKELLDADIISKDEFDAMKKKLINQF